MKVSAREKALFEHYVLATIASGIAIYQTGNHHIKEVAWAAVVGVVGPLLARVNPNSLLNKAVPVVTTDVKVVNSTTTK